MLQLQRNQKTKESLEVKHQDNFRCTMKCGYCRKRQHYEDDCRTKRRESVQRRKAEVERRKYAGKVKPEGGGRNPGRSPSKGNRGGGQGPQPPRVVED